VGSSPLARGRQRVGQVQGGDVGIIPARAGSTLRQASRARRISDHPRSRGVDTPFSCMYESMNGSSPLARGRRGQRGHRRHGLGIIPARAGSTRARRDGHSGPGIIPARAGSTCGQRLLGQTCRDHPRSRGVDGSGSGRGGGVVGSSPLARGRPVPGGPVGDRGGIIPARAGSTAADGPVASAFADHPRSRGVDRTLVRRLDEHSRIIPARAGSTPSPARSRATWWDHPRSRGVDAPVTPLRAVAPGSSPLARGRHNHG